MLYYKDSKGDMVPIDVSLFDTEKLSHSVVILKVGGPGFNPTSDDLNNVSRAMSDFFKELKLPPEGIVLHDKINLEVLDKEQLKNKVLVIKVGDPNVWKPTEQYLQEVKVQFEEAFGDSVKVVVIDAVSNIEIE